MGPALGELMKREMRAWPTAGCSGRAGGALQSQGCREAKGPPSPEPCSGALGQRSPLPGPQGHQLPSRVPSQGWGPLWAGNTGSQKMVLFQMDPGWKCHPGCHLGVTYGLGTSGLTPSQPSILCPHTQSPPLLYATAPGSCHLQEVILSPRGYSPWGTPSLNSPHL